MDSICVRYIIYLLDMWVWILWGGFFVVSCQGGGMVGEAFLLVWWRVVTVDSNRSQVKFFLWLSRWLLVFVGRKGWDSVAANFVSLHSLGFSSGTICMCIGIGP